MSTPIELYWVIGELVMATMLELFVEGSPGFEPKAGLVFQLYSPQPYILGRTDAVDIRILHPAVACQHAVISSQKDTWLIKDMETAEGTMLNGVALEKEQPLRQGDRVEIAGYRFVIEKIHQLQPHMDPSVQ
jgi:pSer/pThr/pTyr-binding forkhead associated (FHA) protein